jgi:type I restriction enzyme S subunit
MAGEWLRISLREANVTLIDCDHRTPPASQVGYPYVAIPQLRNGRIDLSDVRRITLENFVEWTRKAKPLPNDVVLSRRCNPGETAFVPPGLEFALGQNLVLLRADGTMVYPPFLRWVVRGLEWWEQIGKFLNVGAVFDSLKCADVPNFELRIPPLPEQRAIAHILGTLDDKIELNRRMNETLEAMARALFKSWFVDFDPVRAKAEGRAPILPGSVADLFPNRFEGSELGEIPEGWEAKTWGDLVILEYGKSLREYGGSAGVYPVYGTNGRIGYHSKPLCTHPGIIIGRKGAYRGVHFCGEPFFVIDTAFYVEPRKPVDLRWAYYELLRRDINSMDSGSAIPSTSREDFYSLPVCSAPFQVQQAFSRLLNPLWVRQEKAQHESAVLATLRDTLLPKLISGELRVKDAERALTDTPV